MPSLEDNEDNEEDEEEDMEDEEVLECTKPTGMGECWSSSIASGS